MKTLHANRGLITELMYAAYCIAFALFFAIGYNILDEDEEVMLILFGMIVMIIGAFWWIYEGIRVYRTHWLKYGDGKIAISRISKKYINNIAAGDWEVREDEFLLDEIDEYGLRFNSDNYIELHKYGWGHSRYQTIEYFFRLKNGKKIGYEMMLYTRREKEQFLQYIYEKTGIEFRKEEKEKDKRIKILEAIIIIFFLIMAVMILILISFYGTK